MLASKKLNTGLQPKTHTQQRVVVCNLSNKNEQLDCYKSLVDYKADTNVTQMWPYPSCYDMGSKVIVNCFFTRDVLGVCLLVLRLLESAQRTEQRPHHPIFRT
jgi:hypothetical protein